MNKLSILQLSYLAGWLDADGSILAQIVRRKDYVLKYQLRVSILFTQKMNRIHFLRKFQSEIGNGTVRDRGDGVGELALVGKNSVQAFLQQIQPYLRSKRKQANLVLRICEQLDQTKNDSDKFLELCVLADRVADLNDSKTREVTADTVKQTFIEGNHLQMQTQE